MVASYCGSKVFMFFYHQFFGALRMAGGYFQFQSPQLRVMPMRIPSRTQRNALISLAERLADDTCDAKTFSKAQRELDNLVAEIYELTPEERAIVEAY
jgi:hypothetical protein